MKYISLSIFLSTLLFSSTCPTYSSMNLGIVDTGCLGDYPSVASISIDICLKTDNTIDYSGSVRKSSSRAITSDSSRKCSAGGHNIPCARNSDGVKGICAVTSSGSSDYFSSVYPSFQGSSHYLNSHVSSSFSTQFPTYFLNSDGLLTNSASSARSLFNNSEAIVGAAVSIGGGLLISAGIGLTTLGIVPAAATGLVMVGGVVAIAGLYNIGTAYWGSGSGTEPYMTSNYYPASSSATDGENYVLINMTDMGSQEVKVTDPAGRLTDLHTIPESAVSQIKNATVDRVTGQVTSDMSSVDDIKHVHFNYDTLKATITDEAGFSEEVDFELDDDSNIISHNPALVPNYSPETGTNYSPSVAPAPSGAPIDTSVPVSPAAGVNPDSKEFGILDTSSFKSDTGIIDTYNPSMITELSSQYTEAGQNFNDSVSTIMTSYNNSKAIFENGLRFVPISSYGDCEFNFSFAGAQMNIPTSYFSFLYPLLYAFFFIALHILGIKIYILGAKVGNS